MYTQSISQPHWHNPTFHDRIAPGLLVCVRITLLVALLSGLRTSAFSALFQANSMLSLRAIPMAMTNNGDLATLTGYYSPGDRGGGWFLFETNSPTVDDGGQYIVPNSGVGRWRRLLNGETANVKMWGAQGNGTTNDYLAISNALSALVYGTDMAAGEMLFPRGNYLITNTLVFASWRVQIRGEGQQMTEIRMAPGVQKDILRTYYANQVMPPNSDTNNLSFYDHGLMVQDIGLRFLVNPQAPVPNQVNSCLVIVRPGEAHTIRNIATTGGAYGIRCFGGGAPGLTLRSVTTHDAAMAGVCVEPVNPEISDSMGPIILDGISGDCGYTANQPTASLVLISNCVAAVSVENLKSEQCWGGGVVQYKWPEPSADYDSVSSQGSISIRNFHVNRTSGGSVAQDLLVLRGGTRTASARLDLGAVHGCRYLIRDEVTGRNVKNDVGVHSKIVARLPISYEGTYKGNTNYWDNGMCSRLVVGQTAIYSFVPPVSNAWYRVMGSLPGMQRRHLAGRLTISTIGRESSALEVDVSPFASANPIFLDVVRPVVAVTADLTQAPLVTKARALHYYVTNGVGQMGALDIYVERLGDATTNPELQNRVTVALDINGYEDFDSGNIQLLMPTNACTLSGSATYVEKSLLR